MSDKEDSASVSYSVPVKGSPPWTYVVGLYLPFGIMQALKVQLPVPLFKLLGFSNEVVGIIGGLGILATLRFLYAPWLDGSASKRALALFTNSAAAVIFLLAALIIFAQAEGVAFLWTMIPILAVLVVVAAAHETASDGYYIRALDAKKQAQYIGIKAAVIRMGVMSAGMGLLLLATWIAAKYGATGADSEDKTGFHIGFACAYGLSSLILVFFFFWNWYNMPVLADDQPVKHERFAILEVLREYISQNRVIFIIALILLYRLGDGFLAGMKIPFYLDPGEDGGLGLVATSIPYYTLLTDAPWMILGGIMGGFIIKWYGIRKVFLPLALCHSIPNIAYVLLASFQPDSAVHFLGQQLNVWVLVASSLESLGYGLSFSAMFYYMHITATEAGRNKTSILAISFALMNLGWFLPIMMSGFVQAAVGYIGLFVISTIGGLIILLIIPFIPEPKSEQKVTT